MFVFDASGVIDGTETIDALFKRLAGLMLNLERGSRDFAWMRGAGEAGERDPRPPIVVEIPSATAGAPPVDFEYDPAAGFIVIDFAAIRHAPKEFWRALRPTWDTYDDAVASAIDDKDPELSNVTLMWNPSEPHPGTPELREFPLGEVDEPGTRALANELISMLIFDKLQGEIAKLEANASPSARSVVVESGNSCSIHVGPITDQECGDVPLMFNLERYGDDWNKFSGDRVHKTRRCLDVTNAFSGGFMPMRFIDTLSSHSRWAAFHWMILPASYCMGVLMTPDGDWWGGSPATHDSESLRKKRGSIMNLIMASVIVDFGLFGAAADASASAAAPSRRPVEETPECVLDPPAGILGLRDDGINTPDNVRFDNGDMSNISDLWVSSVGGFLFRGRHGSYPRFEKPPDVEEGPDVIGDVCRSERHCGICSVGLEGVAVAISSEITSPHRMPVCRGCFGSLPKHIRDEAKSYETGYDIESMFWDVGLYARETMVERVKAVSVMLKGTVVGIYQHAVHAWYYHVRHEGADYIFWSGDRGGCVSYPCLEFPWAENIRVKAHSISSIVTRGGCRHYSDVEHSKKC